MKMKIYLNLRDTMKVVLRGKFRANIKTLEKLHTNNVRTCLKALEKQEIIPKRKKVIGKNNEVQS